MNIKALILHMTDNGWVLDRDDEEVLGFTHSKKSDTEEWVRDYSKKDWSFVQFNAKQMINLKVSNEKKDISIDDAVVC